MTIILLYLQLVNGYMAILLITFSVFNDTAYVETFRTIIIYKTIELPRRSIVGNMCTNHYWLYNWLIFTISNCYSSVNERCGHIHGRLIQIPNLCNNTDTRCLLKIHMSTMGTTTHKKSTKAANITLSHT